MVLRNVEHAFFRLSGETEDAPLWSGADLIVYSDAGVTEVGRWDGATGNMQPNAVDFPEIAAPGSPTTNYIRLYAVEDSDFTVLQTITDLGVENRINQDTFRIARNTTVGELAKGTVVRFSGSTGNKPNIAAAQANAIGTMPAVGILNTAVGANNYGEVMVVGRLSGVKTNYTNVANPTYAPVADWAEGDVLYVNSTVLGALQNSVPVHPNFAQWVATVEIVHATQGAILVKMQAMLGTEDGTNSNTFTIGDTGTGTKSLKFDGTADAQIDWNGTALSTASPLALGGQTHWTGTGGLVKGTCYGNHIGWAQASAVQNTWYNIADSDMVSGPLNGVTHDGNGKLTVSKAGMYFAAYSICFEDSIANNHIEVGLEVSGSGSAEANGQAHAENKFANQEEHLSAVTLLDLAENATVEVAIRTTDATTPDISVQAVNLTVAQWGGT